MNKDKEKKSGLTCPSCGFEAKSADEMQAHMRDTKEDPAHTAAAGVFEGE